MISAFCSDWSVESCHECRMARARSVIAPLNGATRPRSTSPAEARSGSMAEVEPIDRSTSQRWMAASSAWRRLQNQTFPGGPVEGQAGPLGVGLRCRRHECGCRAPVPREPVLRVVGHRGGVEDRTACPHERFRPAEDAAMVGNEIRERPAGTMRHVGVAGTVAKRCNARRVVLDRLKEPSMIHVLMIACVDTPQGPSGIGTWRAFARSRSPRSLARTKLVAMDRTVVFGRGGAGKSVFARALGEKIGAEVIELDKLFWNDSLEPMGAEAWAERQASLAAEPRWVMDGDLGPYDIVEPRLARAETVVVLDLPLWLCGWRVWRRGRERRDFWAWTLRWRRANRPQILQAIVDIAPGAELVVITDRGAVEEWLREHPP